MLVPEKKKRPKLSKKNKATKKKKGEPSRVEAPPKVEYVQLQLDKTDLKKYQAMLKSFKKKYNIEEDNFEIEPKTGAFFFRSSKLAGNIGDKIAEAKRKAEAARLDGERRRKEAEQKRKDIEEKAKSLRAKSQLAAARAKMQGGSEEGFDGMLNNALDSITGRRPMMIPRGRGRSR